jgi:hypothetical protein
MKIQKVSITNLHSKQERKKTQLLFQNQKFIYLILHVEANKWKEKGIKLLRKIIKDWKMVEALNADLDEL